MTGAYDETELARIEEALGAKARRNAVARFDIRQGHLTEFAGGRGGGV